MCPKFSGGYDPNALCGNRRPFTHMHFTAARSYELVSWFPLFIFFRNDHCTIPARGVSTVLILLLLIKMTDLEFVVARQPQRGRLVRHKDGTVLPVIQFNMEDLTAGRIAYKHDQVSPDEGAATVDTLSFVACLSMHGKRSEPRTVHVAIAARNVQPPSLTNHRMLKVNIGINEYFCVFLLFIPQFLKSMFQCFLLHRLQNCM